MKILLVFPPASDPRGPHLALACLAAVLRERGHSVEMWDLDLEISSLLLTPDTLNRARERCREKMDELDREKERGYEHASHWHSLYQACRNGAHLPEQITAALNVLRTGEFFDREKFRWARRTINSALDLVSLSTHPRLRYRMDNQIFETAYRSDVFDELEKAVADDAANLFGPLYAEHVLPRVSRLKPDFIGLSILNYQQIIPGLTLAARLVGEGWKVFIGGTVFVKLIPALQQEIRFFKFCDGVIVYEGESALLQLIEAMERGESLQGVQNLIFPCNGEVKANTPFRAENINELPTPDFHGLPLDRYMAPHPVLPYNLGKGCYWGKCRFCDIAYSNMFGGDIYRVKKVGLIAGQLEELSFRHATPYFQFTDESCPPELLASVSSELIARKAGLRYLCYGRFEKGFTKELCRHLYRGGCRKILFGLESGSQRRLDALNKGISVRQAEEVLRNCHEAGIHYKVFAMIGLPHETVEEAYETFDFFKRNRDLFLSPFNHFEFSPFHLDRHSTLGKDPEGHGLRDIAGRDDPFSLGGWSFATGAGMEPGTVRRLYREITGELYNLLRVQEKYSGWEEYSVLTIDHYMKAGSGITA